MGTDELVFHQINLFPRKAFLHEDIPIGTEHLQEILQAGRLQQATMIASESLHPISSNEMQMPLIEPIDQFLLAERSQARIVFGGGFIIVA